MQRGLIRDAGWMGSTEEARRRYEQRYVPGERLYLDAMRPWEVADVVVLNENFAAPTLRFREPEDRPSP
jgi:uridine kinase